MPTTCSTKIAAPIILRPGGTRSIGMPSTTATRPPKANRTELQLLRRFAPDSRGRFFGFSATNCALRKTPPQGFAQYVHSAEVFARRAVRAPTDEGHSSAHEDLNFQRADEPLGPNGASAVTTFLPLLFHTERGTYSGQMNIYDRAAKNKKKIGR